MKMRKKKLLIFVHHTLETTTRSGIQRVVVELCRALLGKFDVDFVKWDARDGQLRYVDVRDIGKLFANEDIHIKVNPYCHCVRYRFGDTLVDPESTTLIFPEIPYLLPNGNDIFARIISQCKYYGVSVASIFYDLIPYRDSDYAEGRKNHVEYMIELLRCDNIIAISQFAADDLVNFYSKDAAIAKAEMPRIKERISAVLLGEHRPGEAFGFSERRPRRIGDSPSIVLLGTVEPRKQQTRFLRIFNDLIDKNPVLKNYRIDIFGSLHPKSSDDLHREITRNRNIIHHKYSPDAVIAEAMARADFSVFPSRSEGFGLPIVESLRHGVPCLTASFGSMSEVATNGGCVVADVMSDEAIATALLEMVGNPQKLQSLRVEIASRRSWSWEDYADALVSRLGGHERFSDTVLTKSGDWLALAGDALKVSDYHEAQLEGILWRARRIKPGSEVDAEDLSQLKTGVDASFLWVELTPEDLRQASIGLLREIAEADILCFSGERGELEYAKIFLERNVERLLPKFRFFGGRGGLLKPGMAEAVSEITRALIKRRERAAIEAVYADAAVKLRNELPRPSYELAIVISTYNRARFTEMNLKWLDDVTRGLEDRVCLVVLDNASTDDTIARLEPCRSRPHIRILSNPANVGMLGNLNIASTLSLARHVWMIGDDDFIIRGAIERVLDVLKTQPRLPVLSHNFGVYHRFQVSEGDSPSMFQAEAVCLAPKPSRSGNRVISAFAQEHDNLFTAIYPLVFRSDILAACFNYPFDGVPFADLVESIPTTKIILETLSDCTGYWFAEMGIAGNAHNSWSSHRPRWHLVLMPTVFYLCRQAGMKPEKVWQWLNVHMNLFYEAIEISQTSKKSAHLATEELTRAEWMFQRTVDIPAGVKVYTDAPTPLMHFK